MDKANFLFLYLLIFWLLHTKIINEIWAVPKASGGVKKVKLYIKVILWVEGRA